MADDYLKRLENKKKLIEGYQKDDRWIRVSSNNYNYFGKVAGTKLDMLLLQPSLVFEDRDDFTARLEEKNPTIIDLNSVSIVSPMQEDYIEYFLSKNKKGSNSAGFNTK
jgi:hypothetical protein